MSYANMRERLKDLLESIEGIGVVRTFLRHSKFANEIKKDHTKDGRISSWQITRTTIEQEIDSIQGLAGTEAAFKEIYEIKIIGWFGLTKSGESEHLFQDLIDEIRKKIRQNNRLGGVVLIPSFAQVPIIDHRKIGSALVHYTEIVYTGNERVGGQP